MKVRVPGTMGSALIQGSDFHFNFLLSGVDVCGESCGRPTAEAAPSPRYLLAWNPSDLGSASYADATPAGSLDKEEPHKIKQANSTHSKDTLNRQPVTCA